MKELLCQSGNDNDVYIDLESTNINLHVLENPDLIDLVREVAQDSELIGANVAIEKDLGRVVGTTSCVETNETDEIVYAKRLQRDSFSRFVKNRELKDTQHVSVIFFEKEYGYLVWTAWCGKLIPSVPDSEGRMRTVEGFWSNHALVFDAEIIQPETLTTELPAGKKL